MKADDLQEKKRGRVIWAKFIRIAAVFSAILLAAFLTGSFVLLILLNRGLPSVESLKHYEPKEVSQVFSEHGELIGEFYDERRYVAKEIPERVRQAFIAAEDSNFYFHKGVDFVGVLRAAYVNMTSHGLRQGASTITQQVARGFLLSPEKTFSRKLKEVILAWQIENNLTKDEILHLYLNHIYLGNGAYGVAAAAKVYFGKELHDISIAEAAILGGLPQAPSRYSPSKNPDRVKRRQLYVLKQMHKNNFISADEAAAAGTEDIFIQPSYEINKSLAPYFTEYVRQYVMNKYGSANILKNGFKIFTTLDVDMNHAGENALRKGLSELEKRQGYQGPLKRLNAAQMKDYFKGREFEEREDETVVPIQELEVSATEAQGKGEIRMKPPRKLEVGEWLEGLVQKVDDAKGEALVEYEPNYFARISYEDVRWAHPKYASDDDDVAVRGVSKISDVLKVGDVILMSVKNPNAKPVEAFLEQQTEVEGALLSMDPHNGYVKAMIGGYDFNRSQFNRAVQAKRQPGSAFKPIIYAAALDMGFTPASVLQDSPITFENAADQDKWRPSNFDQKFVGDTTLRNSLLASRNITTIKLLNSIGIDTAVDYARKLGIESNLQRDFTLGLGSSVVTLPEILQPYIVFATGGYRKKPLMIKKIIDRNGLVVEDNVGEDFAASSIEAVRTSVGELKKDVAAIEFAKTPSSQKEESVSFLQDAENDSKVKRKIITSALKPGQVLSTETSFLMTQLLKENVLYGSGRRARDLDRPACGKTGTTDENRDAWFVGFTPNLVTGVWVGYDDLRILGKQETGSRAAVPIWLDYMMKATAPYPKTDFPVPESIEFARIDPKTGGLASPKDKTGIFEAFVKGTAPTEEKSAPTSDSDLYQREQ
ncbi:MAG: PBP1A family penicillin-binding protein [Deltaproteobacteria bacterium]|nr:PBP1A family penicillin-binding protein [Deltaproteobacteria bacterium]